MKRTIIALILVMIFGATYAFADNMKPVENIYVEYGDRKVEMPAITFTFKVSNFDVEGTQTITKETMPSLIGDASVTFEKSKTYQKKMVTGLFLPEYTEAGLYKYRIEANETNFSGISIFNDRGTIYIHVYVTNRTDDDGKIIGGFDTSVEYYVPKGMYFKEVELYGGFAANNLRVKKVVEGQYGDKTKAFKVNARLETTDGKAVRTNITVGDVVYTPDQWNGRSLDITFDIKDGEVVTIEDIPTAVWYEIKEHDYSDEGYITHYSGHRHNVLNYIISKEPVVITNVKNEMTDAEKDADNNDQETADKDSNENKQISEIVKTGDSVTAQVYIGLFVGSATVAMIMLSIILKKRSEDE